MACFGLTGGFGPVSSGQSKVGLFFGVRIIVKHALAYLDEDWLYGTKAESESYRLGSILSDEWNDLPRRFELLREIYELMTPAIKRDKGRNDPYFANWVRFMTPIEMNLWQDIRCNGLPFFPQYPIGGFFVDFADPIKHIALEADGAMWHNEKKDAQRDAIIEDMGWRVFRFTGADTFKLGVLNGVLRLYGKPEIREEEWLESEQ